jgi:hypothetical protein
VVPEPSVIDQLSAAAMRELEKTYRQVAARFHAMVFRTIPDRLAFSNVLVAALQR